MSTTVNDENLDRALASGGRAVVNVGQGKAEKTLIGALVATEDGRIKVLSGKPGRPAYFKREDVNNVTVDVVEPRPEGVNENTNVVVASDNEDGDTHEGHDLTPAEVEANPATEGQAPSFE